MNSTIIVLAIIAIAVLVFAFNVEKFVESDDSDS